MIMKNKIILAMLIATTSIFTITSTVYADLPRDPLTWIQPGDHLMIVTSQVGAIISELDILSYTMEYSYNGMFNDTISETTIFDPPIHGDSRDIEITIINLEAGHEYFARGIATNADGNSTSDIVSTIPGTGTYTMTTDMATYENGTALQPFDSVVYTNQTLTVSGIFLKDDLPFTEGQIDFVFWSGSEEHRIVNIVEISDDVWVTNVLVDLPKTWEGNVVLYGVHVDEFGVDYLGPPGFYVNYEYRIPDDACEEGYVPEIIDDEGNFICNVTLEWHDELIEIMQETIDGLREDVKVLEDGVSVIETDLVVMSDDISVTSNDIDDTQDEIVVLEDTIVNMQVTMDDMLDDINASQAEVSQLENQIRKIWAVLNTIN